MKKKGSPDPSKEKGYAIAPDLTIEAQRIPEEPKVFWTHRIKPAVIEPPAIVIMNYPPGMLPPPDGIHGDHYVVWRPYPR